MTIRISTDYTDVEYVVCALATDPSPFPGNVKGLCSECGAIVHHRPHVPPGIPLICWRCYVAYAAAHPHEALVSPQSVTEVLLHRRRN